MLILATVNLIGHCEAATDTNPIVQAEIIKGQPLGCDITSTG